MSPFDMRPSKEIEIEFPAKKKRRRKTQTEKRHELVKRARKIIADKKHWMREDFAVDKHGYPVMPEEDTAVKFCAHGALMKAASELNLSRTKLLYSTEYQIAAQFQTGAYCVWGLAFINDEYGHKTVLKCFDSWLKKNPVKQDKAT